MKSKLLPLFFLLLFLLSVQLANAQLRLVDNKGSILKVDPSKWVVGINGVDIYNKNIDNSGKVGVGTKTPAATLHNAGSTILGMTDVTNSSASYTVALATVDEYSGLVVTQNTTACVLTLPDPTNKTAGRVFTVSNAISSTKVLTANSCTIPAGYSTNFVWNGSVWTVPSTVASSLPLSGLTAAIAANTIDNTSFDQRWNWNSATTGSPLTLGSSSLTSGNLLSLTTGNASQTGSALALTTNTTAGSALQINATGAYTATTGLLNLAANAATTGTAMGITANGLTGGTALKLSSTSAGLSSGSLLNASGVVTSSTTNGLINIVNTATTSTGKVVTIQANSAAGSGVTVLANGNVGIGTTSPTATLQLAAGTSTAGTSPLKLTSGVNLATAETGAIEYDGSHFYGTAGTNRLPLDNNSLTGTAGGTAQAQTVTNNLSTLTKGMIVSWIPTLSNTALDPTLALGSSSAVTIKKSSGGAIASLTAGDIAAGIATTAIYDGTQWVLQNPQKGSSLPISSLTAAIAANTIDNTSFDQNWNWNSATTGSPLTLGSSSLTSGNLLSLTTGNASQTGSALALTTNTTAGSALQINATGAYTATTGLLNLAANAATTGTAMGITANGLTGGTGLNLATSSTALTTANLLKLSSTGAATSATGYLADISNTASTATGGLLQAASNSTAAPSNGLVHYNFSGAHANSGVQIDDATVAGNAMTINANSLTTGTALNIASTSTVTTGGQLLNISSSGAIATANTITGATIKNTHTGGVATNVGLSVTATGGANNYAIVVPSGNVGIGTATPGSILEVNGAAVNTAPTVGTIATIDFSLNNLAFTSAIANAFTLNNIKSGGAYTLVLTGVTNTGTATFTASGFTVKYMGTTAMTTAKTHIYSFIAMGTTVYVTMATEN